MVEKIIHVVGARPNFMKAAPVLATLDEHDVEQLLVHTGQHYDRNMSEVFFEELGMPRPDINLEVGSGSHAYQTGEVMKRFEDTLNEEEPDLVLVYGDVNSTIAATLVASKLQVTVGHVEAGLRSFDRRMPEEINRVCTDRISDLLFTHSPEANEHLQHEGVDEGHIYFVGNVMIDTLVRLLPRARKRETAARLLPDGDRFVLATLHRPSNVDQPDRLRQLIDALQTIGQTYPVVFPAHPRTRERAAEFGVDVDEGTIRFIEPLGYLDFLSLQDSAEAVITDSGGIQEETTYLGVPCFTVRENTERPVTISSGTNRLMGDDVEELADAVLRAAGLERDDADPPRYWDGKAAQRIARVVAGH